MTHHFSHGAFEEECPEDVERLASRVLEVARDVYRSLGGGMYESVYQRAMEIGLRSNGIAFVPQAAIRATYLGFELGDALHADLVVEGRIVVELKSTPEIHPAFESQLLTYMRTGRYPLGFIVNFGAQTFGTGVRRKIFSKFF